MKFDFVIGNPPYQEEAENKSETNGQTRSKSIFQYFQMEAEKIANTSSVLIYPGGRWIQRSGKGMKEFGLNQINDMKLKNIYFYPNSHDIFPNAAIADGISIVIKEISKEVGGFKYVYCESGKEIVANLENPGEDIIPLNPLDRNILKKIDKFVSKNNIKYLHDRIHPQKLFGIESDFVEKNREIVREYNANSEIDLENEIKLYTNDKAGKAGRTRWFIVDKNIITTNSEYIYKWKVVVSSANAGGQKRDNQLEIIDNHSAFGRSRVALATFETEEEAKNFYTYVKSYIIKWAFLMTDEALTTCAYKVPDIIGYKNDNKYIDFKKDIDMQLVKMMNITEDEFEYIRNVVDNRRKKEME